MTAPMRRRRRAEPQWKCDVRDAIRALEATPAAWGDVAVDPDSAWQIMEALPAWPRDMPPCTVTSDGDGGLELSFDDTTIAYNPLSGWSVRGGDGDIADAVARALSWRKRRRAGRTI